MLHKQMETSCLHSLNPIQLTEEHPIKTNSEAQATPALYSSSVSANVLGRL